MSTGRAQRYLLGKAAGEYGEEEDNDGDRIVCREVTYGLDEAFPQKDEFSLQPGSLEHSEDGPPSTRSYSFFFPLDSRGESGNLRDCFKARPRGTASRPYGYGVRNPDAEEERADG